jgi:hypothetical protein
MKLVTLSIAALWSCGSCTAAVVAQSPESTPPPPPSPLLHVLFYETQDYHEHSSHVQTLLAAWSHVDPSLVQAQVVGQGTSFEGYGSKYAAVYPILKALPHDDGRLVVLSDSRDVLINAPASSALTSSASSSSASSSSSLRAAAAAPSLDVVVKQAVRDFVDRHARLTRDYPDALVVSAEAQCCVSALTFVQPGDYYDQFGARNARACASGEADCTWQGDVYAVPWQSYMQGLAVNRTSHNNNNNDMVQDVYLNAGLMVGTVPNLLRVLEQAQIGKDEDDQAVLTDFMYHHPNAIVLDYHQELFGNNRGGLQVEQNQQDRKANTEDAQCVFDWSPNDEHHAGRLVHTKTKTSPLFVHSPGGFLDCQDRLAMKLGLFDATEMAIRQERRRLYHSSDRALCNYGGGCGCHDNYRGGCNGCGGCNGGGGDGYYPPSGGGYDGGSDGDEYPNKHQLFVNIGIGAHYQNNLDRGPSGQSRGKAGKMGNSSSSGRTNGSMGKKGGQGMGSSR